jgi:hypothetical protein
MALNDFQLFAPLKEYLAGKQLQAVATCGVLLFSG